MKQIKKKKVSVLLTHEGFKNLNTKIILGFEWFGSGSEQTWKIKLASYNELPFPDDINLIFSFFLKNSIFQIWLPLLISNASSLSIPANWSHKHFKQVCFLHTFQQNSEKQQ